ncbi:MAG: hypothetical protein DRI33_02660 [Caldiserica bacterium]|nr:MAG: hypothetical protein DRI33_02660 [Caldisericota bacterium]
MKKFVKLIGVWLIVICVVIVGVYILNIVRSIGNINTNPDGTAVEVPMDLTKNINILILGTDQRDMEEAARTDVIMVVNINPKTRKASLFSIPRDTRVFIPGHGYDKINSAYNFLYIKGGGPELTIKAVENLLGLNEGDIPYFAVVNFEGFIKVINALGGVDIYVEEPMHYHSMRGDVIIDIEAGMQHFDGEKALEYARFRHDQYGDYRESEDGSVHGRVIRQQELVQALIEQSKSWNTIWRLPTIAEAVGDAIYTNITTSQITKIALIFKNISGDDLNIIPFTGGTDEFIDAKWYIVPDYDKLKEIGSEYFSTNGQNDE